jgi:hypothetical protein
MRRAIVYLRQCRSDMMPPDRLPNKAHSANPAVSLLFHAGCQWRGVAEVRRWAL